MKKMNIVRRRGLGFKGGFTLIELLVVIAIIGILSSVVLVSLNSARSKGVSTRIQEDAANLRTNFETNFTGSVYSTDLTASAIPAAGSNASDTQAFSANGLTLKSDINAEGGQLYVYDNCGASACANTNSITGYVIEVQGSGTANGFCVDSKGNTATGLTGSTFTSPATRGQTCPTNGMAL